MARLIGLPLPDRMIRDVSRDSLPARSGYNLVDYIPAELGAPLAKRGGFSYASDSLADYISNTVDRVSTVLSFPRTAGHQLLAVARDDGTPANRFLQILSTSSETDRGSCSTPTQPLVFYRDQVFLFNTSEIQRYDGASNIANMSSTPGGERGCAYKDHLVNARSSGQPQRVWFSDAGDATTWNTTTGWIDTDSEVTAIYPLRNALLCFHAGSLERIIGSIPPPGSDMYLQPVWDTGTDQPFSLAGTDQWVMFSNASGVYKTDGAEVIDVTRLGGMKSYWQALFPNATARIASGGYYRGYYFVSVHDASPLSLLDCFMIDVQNYRWMRLSNITSTCFTRRTKDFEELYWGDSGQARVNASSSLWSPASGVKNDADGIAVTPVGETAFYRMGRSKGRAKDVYVNYDLRDAASDNPVITVAAVYSPESTSYTSLSPTLSETTAEDDARVHIRKAAFGVGLKFTQTNASSVTKLYGLNIDAHPREDSRLA